ncbi:MAG: hypothetical protein O2854_05690 [Chloroflexi bacterium]|nr:hypothetical protein [Chloroflexota bacterium]
MTTENTEKEPGLSKYIELEPKEKVIYENDEVVITSKRVFAEFKPGIEGTIVPRRESYIRDIATVQKLRGGQESRLFPGIRYTLAGVAVGALGYFLEVYDIFHSAIDAVTFLISALVLGVGLYLTTTSLIRVKPHTSVMFIIFGKKDIRVPYPGHNNPEADKVAAAFTRAKRSY